MTTLLRPESCRVRARLPVELAWRDVIRFEDGSVASVSHLWTTWGRWQRCPERASGDWHHRRLALFVLAYRVVR